MRRRRAEPAAQVETGCFRRSVPRRVMRSQWATRAPPASGIPAPENANSFRGAVQTQPGAGPFLPWERLHGRRGSCLLIHPTPPGAQSWSSVSTSHSWRRKGCKSLAKHLWSRCHMLTEHLCITPPGPAQVTCDNRTPGEDCPRACFCPWLLSGSEEEDILPVLASLAPFTVHLSHEMGGAPLTVWKVLP